MRSRFASGIEHEFEVLIRKFPNRFVHIQNGVDWFHRIFWLFNDRVRRWNLKLKLSQVFSEIRNGKIVGLVGICQNGIDRQVGDWVRYTVRGNAIAKFVPHLKTNHLFRTIMGTRNNYRRQLAVARQKNVLLLGRRFKFE